MSDLLRAFAKRPQSPYSNPISALAVSEVLIPQVLETQPPKAL